MDAVVVDVDKQRMSRSDCIDEHAQLFAYGIRAFFQRWATYHSKRNNSDMEILASFLIVRYS